MSDNKKCPAISNWEEMLKTRFAADNWEIYTPSFITDYNDAEIWKDSTFKPSFLKECSHSKKKEVKLFTSSYFICEDCGEEV
jgi:hypothetical protein